MVVCFFSAQYLPNFGGVERFTAELAKRVVRDGGRAIVVASRFRGLAERETSPDGVEVIRLPVFSLMGGRFPVLKPSPTFFRLTKWLWSQPLDACVINTRFYTSSVYAAAAAKRHRVKAIVIEHGSGHLLPPGGITAWIGHIYEHIAAGFLHRRCKRFFGVSQGAAAWLSHFRIPAAGVLYNAVDCAEIDRLSHAADAVDWRKALSLSENEKIVLFSGRLIPEKGIQELLLAFHALHRTDAHLVVAGDGPLSRMLSAAPEKNVHYLGMLTWEALMPLYRQSDVYCFPSCYAEGFPTALLEAGACACAVVSSHVSGADEIVSSEEYGFVLPAVTPEAIRAALDAALTNDARRARVGAALSTRVRSNFTWKQSYARLMEILTEERNSANGFGQRHHSDL